jgi:hypothetical protein
MLALCVAALVLTMRYQAHRLLKSLSIKQGRKYDDPESACDIPTFIEFHRLDVDEILDPIDSFSKYPSCHLSALV